MPLPKSNNYTIEDIYSLPDGQRAELIDGQIYDMAPPSPFQQELVMELSATLRDYIKKNSGSCKVYPAPFAVFLNQDDHNYVEPDISVICDPNRINEKGCNGAPDFMSGCTGLELRGSDGDRYRARRKESEDSGQESG